MVPTPKRQPGSPFHLPALYRAMGSGFGWHFGGIGGKIFLPVRGFFGVGFLAVVFVFVEG